MTQPIESFLFRTGDVIRTYLGEYWIIVSVSKPRATYTCEMWDEEEGHIYFNSLRYSNVPRDKVEYNCSLVHPAGTTRF